MAFWRQLRGIGPPVTIRDFRGVNKLDAFSIADGQFASTKNMTGTAYPAVTVRPGYSLLGTSLGAPVRGLGVWTDSELHAIANGSWKKWTGSAWGSALATGLSTTDRASFCNFQGNFAAIALLMANGTQRKKYLSGSVSDLTDAPTGLNYIDAHDNRVYGAVGSRVWASAFRDAEDWDDSVELDTGAWWGEIETPDGSDIVGMRAGSQHLTVFKPYHTFELFGTGRLNFRLKPVSDQIGCISNASVVNLGGVLYWVSHRGIERYTGGVAPSSDFALPVQWYIENINAANRSKTCAGTDGQRCYFAIPLQSNTEPSHVIEYDPQFGGIFHVWELGNYPYAFAYMAEEWYYGDSIGQVRKMGGTDDEGAAIAWELVSKPFGSGALAQRKKWYNMWIVLDLPIGSTCSVYLSKMAEGDSDWILAKTLTADADIQSTRIIIPVNTVANANYVRYKLIGTGPATLYEMTRKERLLPYV